MTNVELTAVAAEWPGGNVMTDQPWLRIGVHVGADVAARWLAESMATAHRLTHGAHPRPGEFDQAAEQVLVTAFAATAHGHLVEWDPPAASAAERWTCVRCGMAALRYGGEPYGPATTADCPEVELMTVRDDLTKPQRRLVDALAGAPTSLTVSALAELLGVPRSTVRPLVRVLTSKGVVHGSYGGLYEYRIELTGAGKACALRGDGPGVAPDA